MTEEDAVFSDSGQQVNAMDAVFSETGHEVTELSAVARPPSDLGVPRVAWTPTQLALYIGWTMALLHEGSAVPAAGGTPALPVTHELSASDRRDLELGRLRHLLAGLALIPECDSWLTDVPAQGVGEDALKAALEGLNLKILRALAKGNPTTAVAYELGHSLRQTVEPSHDHVLSRAGALSMQLARDRVIGLQDSLASLTLGLPPSAASIVATSIGRWSEFTAVTVDTTKPPLKRRVRADGREMVATAMRSYLLLQGDIWLKCLLGTTPTSGLLTSEGYVAAVDGALHRSTKSMRAILQHYGAVLVLVGAITVGVLFMAAAYLGGAAKFWTSIATIAGYLGLSAGTVERISARTVKRTSESTVERIGASANLLGNMAVEAERPIYSLAELDAMTWAITTLPPLKLTARGARQLRKAGIVASTGLGRV